MLRSTRTYAILELSAGAYEEIKGKLLAAGYQHALHQDRTHGLVLDMDGIAIAEEPTEQQVADAHLDATLSKEIERVRRKLKRRLR